MDRNADAKREIEQAVALDPTFENGYELAIVDLDLGDGDGASKIFSEMLASFGDTAAIHLLFGQAYEGSDFQTKALDEFKASAAKDDRLPGVHYSLASAYLTTGGNSKLPQVEAELRKELTISPNSAFVYAALGHLLATQGGNSAEALTFLKRATELDPSSPDGFLYLGQFYADAKMPAEAEPVLRKSIALTRDVSRNGYQVQKAHYLLGRVLMQTGHADEGKQELAASQALLTKHLARDRDQLADYLQPSEPSVSQGMGPASPLNADPVKDAKAAQLTDEFEKQFTPAIADSYNNLGAIAGAENNYRLALQYFEQAGAWNPALPGLDYNWGRAAFAAGATSEAVAPLSRYVSAHPEDDGGRAVLGLSQFLSKDYTGARNTLAALADKAGQSAQVRFAFAESLVETNDLGAGTARLIALAKEYPDIADVHRSLGEVYALQNAPGAASELATAIRLNPDDAEAHAVLGRLESKEGDTKAAMTDLEAAVKLDPNDAELRRELEQLRAAATHE
jgi:tetratricopeptide (TPR) repeat protein